MFFCRDNRYALDSIILFRDCKSIIDRAFLTAPLRVYLYIMKIDNKYGKYLIDIMRLRRIFLLNILLIIYFALEVFQYNTRGFRTRFSSLNTRIYNQSSSN